MVSSRDNDPFGLSGGAMLSEDEIAAVAPFAATVRDNAMAIVPGAFNREAELRDVAIRQMSGADVEAELLGDYFVIEVNLQTPSLDVFPCLTFLPRDETAAALEIDTPADGADWSQPEERLAVPIQQAVETLSALLGGMELGDLTFATPTVRTVSLPDDYPSLLIDADERWIDLTYRVDITDVGDLQGHSLVAANLVRRLAGGETESGSAAPVAVGASRGLASDPLLGLGSDSFAMPTGRTGADILESIPALAESPRGGIEMASHPPVGARAEFAGRAAIGNVNPAAFPAFAEAASREPVLNIDLIMDVNLRVTVELGRTSKSIREVLDLGPGAVIELDKLAGEPVDILVNDKAIAKGEVVVVDENFGVRVTDIVSPASRVATLR